MRFNKLPPYETVVEYWEVSAESPSGLKWIKSPAKCVKPNQIAGSLEKAGYWAVRFKGTTYKVHRIIYLLLNKKDPEELTVDHVISKGNNLKLRLATHSQNTHYRTKTNFAKKTTSAYKGVLWCKQKNKWKARIYVDKKQIWLGYFNLEKDAAEAYNKAAIKFLGSFAGLNLVVV
jgi:excinuclease UvrABC ATPase subunit